MENKQKEKIIEYDILKTIVTILVVIGHSIYSVWSTENGSMDYSQLISNSGMLNSKIYIFASTISSWVYTFHMPLFFALSGSIFHVASCRYTSFEVLLKNKFKRLVVPFLTVSIFYMIPVKFIAHFYSFKGMIGAFSSLLAGKESETGQLWFLPVLFVIFLSFYPLEKYIIRKNSYVGIFASFAVVYLLKKINVEYWWQLSMISTYLPYFIVGYYFEYFRKNFNTFYLKYPIFYTTVFGAISILNSKYNLINNTYIAICFGSLFIYGISLMLSKWKGFYESKAYKVFSKHSFNIYLFHDPLNFLILYFCFIISGSTLMNSTSSIVLYIFSRTIGLMLISILISKLIQKIKIYASMIKVKKDNKILKLFQYIFLLFMIILVGLELFSVKPVIPELMSTSKMDNDVQVYNQNDDYWSNGIINSGSSILFSLTEDNKNKLMNAIALKIGDFTKYIISVDINEEWIVCNFSDDINLSKFAYPNKCEVLY